MAIVQLVYIFHRILQRPKSFVPRRSSRKLRNIQAHPPAFSWWRPDPHCCTSVCPTTLSTKESSLLHLFGWNGQYPGMVDIMGNGTKGEPQPDGCLQRFSHAVESRMKSFFSTLGRLVAKRPYLTLLLSLFVIILGTSGISVIEEESRGDKLWLPSDTRAQDDWVREKCWLVCR